jgi:lactate dehydrogenase-like 2-hydroxyacid dehydrogenase
MTEKKKNPVPANFQKHDNMITNSVARGKKKTVSSEMKTVGLVGDGAIGSTTKKIATSSDTKIVKEKKEVEKVALHSTKNVSWPGVGKISKGYNIVSAISAESWLTRDHVRTATPEELAREFGL